MATIGGGTIKSYRFTRAWGVSPAEAGGQVVLDSSGSGGAVTLEVGKFVTFAFGSIASASGILTEVREVTDVSSGSTYDFTLLDNRIRLGVDWATVIGAWNILDDRVFRRVDRPLSPDSYSSDTSSPGADDLGLDAGVGAPSAVPAVEMDPAVAGNPLSRRRYKHLFPEHARAGIWTFTDEPLSVREILNSAFSGAWAEYHFNRNYHASMSQVFPNGVDHSGGVSLASLISQMLDICGLDMKLEGTRTLVFDRKGDGLPPLPDNYSGTRTQALSLNPKPSKVRVVGDPFRIQIHNLEMQPDWIRGWEQWIDEMAWIRKVGEVYELPSVTKSDCAERAAFARHVTLADFIAEADLPDLADYRAAGRGSRMQMPAWDYIQQFVFRSYRLPDDFTLGGIPLSSLKWSGNLLAGVGVAGSGPSTQQRIRSTQPEIYPDARAHLILKGQPLDLVDGRSITLFSMRRNKDLREEWIEWSEYEVDAENWSVRFRGPVFIDGLVSEGKSILQYVNKGEGSEVDLTGLVDEESDYLDVLVPNPAFEIEPAGVRIAICFEVGQFQKDFGTGPRRTTFRQSGLGMELVDVTGGNGGLGSVLTAADASLLPFPDTVPRPLSELRYANGGTAAQAAAKVAQSIISRPVTQLAGGFPRYGIAGTSLGPCVDRITITIEAGDQGGVTEQIEYTKARPTQAFLAESTLTRLQRVGELFPGQEESRNEVRMLRLIARLENDYSRNPGLQHGRSSVSDIFRVPIGGEHQSTEIFYDKNSQSPLPEGRGWKVGDILWKDEQGFPSRNGTAFGGVVISTPGSVDDVQGKDLQVATRGIVPVRVQGAIAGGASVHANLGDAAASASGQRFIGTLAHASATPVPSEGEVLAMIRLGAAPAEKVAPLILVDSRPSYIPIPEEPSGAGFYRVFMTWGVINDIIADNWDDYFDVELTPSTSMSYLAKVFLNPEAQGVVVDHWEILAEAEPSSLTRPAWTEDGTRPEYILHLLATINVDEDGKPSILNTGGGSIALSEHIVDLIPGGTDGSSNVKKAISVLRLNY